MKKTAFIAFFLAILCLLSACSKVPEESRIPVYDYTLPPLKEETTPSVSQRPSSSNKTETQPSEPAALIGKWYSASAAAVFQFFTDHTVKMFSLAPGYFEYTTVEQGTYTYDGLTLFCSFPSQSGFTFSCSVAGNEMELVTSSQTFLFEAVEELPDQHPSYDFPDFLAIAEKNPLSDGAYIGNTIPTSLRSEALSELRTSYWSSVGINDLVKLESGTAKPGDLVNIDYEGKLDGVAFAGGTAKNQVIEVNDGTGYIDGFCIGIAGHDVGQTFDVPVTFPENYGSSDLAGKDVVFTMTLNCIYDLTLTDEIAVEEGYESLDKWIDSAYEEKLRSEIWNLIPGLAGIEIPEEAYLYFYQYNLDILHAQALYYFNNNFETCLAYYGLTLDSLLEDSKETGTAFYYAALIVEHGDLTADDALKEQVKQDYIKLYTDGGYTIQQAESILENEAKAEFEAYVLQELAVNYLIENNTFTDTEA